MTELKAFAYLNGDLDVDGSVRQMFNNGQTYGILKMKKAFFKVEARSVRILLVVMFAQK